MEPTPVTSVSKEQQWDEYLVYSNCFTSNKGLGLVLPFTVLIHSSVSGNKFKLNISEPQSQAGAIENLRGGQGGGIYDSELKKPSKFSGAERFRCLYLFTSVCSEMR